MKKVIIDLEHIGSPKAALIYIGYLLNFPAYYGRNLDALHDLLTEIDSPVRIALRCPQTLCGEMAAFLPRLERVLKDAAQENGNISLEEH